MKVVNYFYNYFAADSNFQLSNETRRHSAMTQTLQASSTGYYMAGITIITNLHSINFSSV